MKLIDLLKVTDKNTFLVLSISVCGMQFETEHSVEFFINNGDELNTRTILKMECSVGSRIHVRLEN